MTALIITVAALVVISALCSLAEAVLYAYPPSAIEQLGEDTLIGRTLKQLRARIDEPITAILTLNTVANTAGAALAGALAAEALGSHRLGIFSAALTLAILLFSEVIPKTLGVVHAKKIGPLVALPIRGLVLVLKPIVWVIGLVTRLIRTEGGGTVSDEEISAMVRIGHREGAIDETEAAVIDNILHLEHKTVREVMTPRTVMFALNAETTIEAAADDERILNHSRIPLYEGDTDHIVGVAHRRDVLYQAMRGEDGDLIKTLSRPVGTLPGDLPLNEALRIFLAKREHMMVVVDEYGGVDGLVSLEDVLEEILGEEIVDEFDPIEDLQAHARETAVTPG